MTDSAHMKNEGQKPEPKMENCEPQSQEFQPEESQSQDQPDRNQEARELAQQKVEQSFVDSDPMDSQVFIRSVIYSGILERYKGDLDKRLGQNYRFKEVMFWICIGILVMVTAIWCYIICSIASKSTSNDVRAIIQTKLTISSNIALLSAAIIPFITAFIALPHTIVSNLFDHADDKTLKEVLGQMLEHDGKQNRETKQCKEDENTMY